MCFIHYRAACRFFTTTTSGGSLGGGEKNESEITDFSSVVNLLFIPTNSNVSIGSPSPLPSPFPFAQNIIIIAGFCRGCLRWIVRELCRWWLPLDTIRLRSLVGGITSTLALPIEAFIKYANYD